MKGARVLVDLSAEHNFAPNRRTSEQIESEVKKVNSAVTAFYARFNLIKQFPMSLLRFPMLIELDLTGNEGLVLPSDFFSLQELRYLFLGFCLMTTLSSDICKLSKLEGLDLQGNSLQAVPSSLGALKRLSMLGLRQNPLPVGIAGVTDWTVTGNKRGTDVQPFLAQIAEHFAEKEKAQ